MKYARRCLQDASLIMLGKHRSSCLEIAAQVWSKESHCDAEHGCTSHISLLRSKNILVWWLFSTLKKVAAAAFQFANLANGKGKHHRETMSALQGAYATSIQLLKTCPHKDRKKVITASERIPVDPMNLLVMVQVSKLLLKRFKELKGANDSQWEPLMISLVVWDVQEVLPQIWLSSSHSWKS